MNFFCAKKSIEMAHEIFQWISRKLENFITTHSPSNFSLYYVCLYVRSNSTVKCLVLYLVSSQANIIFPCVFLYNPTKGEYKQSFQSFF